MVLRKLLVIHSFAKGEMSLPKTKFEEYLKKFSPSCKEEKFLKGMSLLMALFIFHQTPSIVKTAVFKEHRNGSKTYYRQMLGAAIVHPDYRESRASPLTPCSRIRCSWIKRPIFEIVSKIKHSFSRNRKRNP